MLACLFAMLLSLSTEPPQVGRQVEKPAPQSSKNSTDKVPRQYKRSFFGPDDPTPEFYLHRQVIDQSGDSDTGVDASESKIDVLESTESDDPPESDSVFARYWPYGLMVIVLVGWFVAQFRLKHAPSFKHHVIPERKQREDGSLKGEFKASKRFQKNSNSKSDESAADEMPAVGKTEQPQLNQDDPQLEGQFKVTPVLKAANQDESQLNQDESQLNQDEPRLKGQFKVATRFQKPKSEKAASAIDEETSSLVGPTPDVQQPADTSADRPADDEFEFDELDTEHSASDSVVLSEEERAKILEAAEILAAVGKRKNVTDSSRFK